MKQRDILLFETGNGDSTTLTLGGFHGNEIAGMRLAFQFARYLHRDLPAAVNGRIMIVPVVNPDGLIRRTRTNARGVDINRNFLTNDWQGDYRAARNNPAPSPTSEPEIRAVIMLLEKYAPQRIVSIHMPLNMINYDGPAAALAEKMGAFNGYPVQADIGYPTPGSFGTYAGVERRIPVITLELPRQPFEKICPPF